MNNKNNNNPFRRKEVANQHGKSKKESEWGKVKFNPIARTALTEQATPWSHFKSDLIKQQQDDKQELKLKNVSNSKEIFKKREENYRRNLMKTKINVPTKWEDFSDESQPETYKQAKPPNSEETFQKLPSYIRNINSIKKEDFDAKKLTVQQNCYLKKIITRNAVSQKGCSIESAVADMKLNGVIGFKNRGFNNKLKKTKQKK